MRYQDLLLETVQDQKRTEIKRLLNMLPVKWKDEDGKEVWRVEPSQIDRVLVGKSDDELDDWIVGITTTLEYLKQNPKAVLPDPFGGLTIKAKTTLKTILPRVGNSFMKWLKEMYDPADLKAAQTDESTLLDGLSEYLRDEQNITVREDGLIEFWGLDGTKRKIIGDLPVVLFHYTASKALKSIKHHGLLPDRPSVNYRKAPGVYLTTEGSGNAIDGYARNAEQRIGGYAIKLEVKCYLHELQSDPDDADISSGRHQFMVNQVPPDRIIGSDRYF
jgi:hypothetical protein